MWPTVIWGDGAQKSPQWPAGLWLVYDTATPVHLFEYPYMELYLSSDGASKVCT